MKKQFFFFMIVAAIGILSFDSSFGQYKEYKLNAKGDTLYLAINCGARKMNATSAAGDWRTWDDPQADFERRLVNDLCSSRG